MGCSERSFGVSGGYLGAPRTEKDLERKLKEHMMTKIMRTKRLSDSLRGPQRHPQATRRLSRGPQELPEMERTKFETVARATLLMDMGKKKKVIKLKSDNNLNEKS